MQTYNTGYYVKYVGLLDQYNDNIVQIVGFRKMNDTDYLSLFDLKSKTTFLADYSEIRGVELNENHLKKLGFLKEEINTGLRFKKNSIIISKAIIKENDSNTLFVFGFRIGDITNININLKQYIEGDKINLEKFHLDYPQVTYISELFDYLKRIHIDINELDILIE